MKTGSQDSLVQFHNVLSVPYDMSPDRFFEERWGEDKVRRPESVFQGEKLARRSCLYARDRSGTTRLTLSYLALVL